MTVLIKGMEVPEVCADCSLRSTPELFMLEANRYQYISRCTRAGEEIEDPWRDILWQHKHKESWCPIGDVPTPHGRLIDADALLSVAEPIEDRRGNVKRVVWDAHINRRPTVIEAEK